MVRLRNRWRDNHFIHVEHGSLEAGPIQHGWRSANWAFQAVEGTPFVCIRNGMATRHGLLLHQSGLVCGLLDEDWQGAHWYLERCKGTAFMRFRNRWRQDCYIHCETGSLEATPVKTAWLSAQWQGI
jgi:hypothetical protein